MGQQNAATIVNAEPFGEPNPAEVLRDPSGLFCHPA